MNTPDIADDITLAPDSPDEHTSGSGENSSGAAPASPESTPSQTATSTSSAAQGTQGRGSSTNTRDRRNQGSSSRNARTRNENQPTPTTPAVESVQQTTSSEAANVLQSEQSGDVTSAVRKHSLFVPWRKVEEGTSSSHNGPQDHAPTGRNRSRENTSEGNTTPETTSNHESQSETTAQPTTNTSHETQAAGKKSGRKKITSSNISINPFAGARHATKSAVALTIGDSARTLADAATVLARPQQLLRKQFWKDTVYNIGADFKNLGKIFSGIVYKPHRTRTPKRDLCQDYGTGRGPSSTVGRENGFMRGAGKFFPIPKMLSHSVGGVFHAIADTFTGSFDYKQTKRSFTKAFSWDYVDKAA